MHWILSIFVFLLLSWPLPEKELAIGDPVPAFRMQSLEGDSLISDSLRGHVLVIDFWASWDRPSRIHNLELIGLYEKYRQLSFAQSRKLYFISYSLDVQRDRWVIAKSKDNLHWRTNVSDLMGWESPFVTSFRLSGIPSNFVVDKQGKVVAKNIWGKTLDSVLTTLNRVP